VRNIIPGFLIAGLILPVSGALAQPAPNSEGYRLSAELCARCHVVTAHGPGSWTDAPPFEAIANRPATTRKWLVDFISQPHAHMLTRDYTPAQVNSIAGYILSLRQH
jgi:mono/diheme cytochrome c family protein